MPWVIVAGHIKWQSPALGSQLSELGEQVLGSQSLSFQVTSCSFELVSVARPTQFLDTSCASFLLPTVIAGSQGAGTEILLMM